MRKILFFTTFIFVVTVQLSAQYNFQLLSNKTYTGQNLSGSWGYTDTAKNKEFALVGTTKGLSIVDISIPASPVEVKFINGKQGSWRECQTWKNYAYITQDNDTTNSEGILIYDLSQIPSGKADTFKGTTPNDFIQRNHSLYIDEKGFLYLNGGRVNINGTGNNGTVIYDLKPNPKKPVFVGYTPSTSGTSTDYVHDCYVRNDTMYQAHIYNNRFTVWDVHNRAHPVKIQDFATAYSTIHNMWLSDDSKTLFVTHEQFGFPAEAYDVSDMNNIRQLCEFKVSPTNQEIAHNVHVLHDYLICSYYSDGVAIFDASDPTNVITIGYYDTQPTSTRTENGVWGAFGFYKSGVITLSDMIRGLFVVKPTYIRAARIQGVVTDTNTTQPIATAQIYFIDTAISVKSNIDGIYKTGTPKAGTFNFKAVKAGYQTKFFTATLVNGKIDTVNIRMRQIPVYASQSASFCQNRSYTLPDGRIVTSPGTYISDLVLPSGKDSIITTTLSARPTSSSTKVGDICQGQTYNLPNGKTTTISGIFKDTFSNSFGCDSILTTYVFVHPTYSAFKEDTIYKGDVYILPNGTPVTTSGDYTNNLLTNYGCDSIITVYLFVKDTSTTTGIHNTISDIELKFIVQDGELRILNHSSSKIVRLDIYNSIGTLVNSFDQPESILYLSLLPKDIYIIRAFTNRDEQHIGKIVIY